MKVYLITEPKTEYYHENGKTKMRDNGIRVAYANREIHLTKEDAMEEIRKIKRSCKRHGFGIPKLNVTLFEDKGTHNEQQ